MVRKHISIRAMLTGSFNYGGGKIAYKKINLFILHFVTE